MIPDELIVAGVLGMRLLVPLTILRYPLPGIIAALLADAVDGAIFSGFTNVSLENYQHYDKALDIYYLAIAHIATLRNWTDPAALRIAHFLWYYRLVGVALFAVFDERLLLFLFPATFEYFFIFYEAVRSRWWPERLRWQHLVAAAGSIWVVIKLPQEYWVHVAQRSTTDWVKEAIFGVDPSTTRIDAIASNPGAAIALLAGALGLVALGWLALRWLPPADHRWVFDANRSLPGAGTVAIPGRPKPIEPVFSAAVAEKIALVALTAIIFAEFLPGVHATVAQMAGGVAIVVVSNAAISHWSARRGGTWRTAVLEFVAMSAVNAGVVFTAVVLTRWTDASLHAGTALFYALLFTLLITLYDRYRYLHLWQEQEGGEAIGVRGGHPAVP